MIKNKNCVWSYEEDEILLKFINSSKKNDWKTIASLLKNKKPIQCFYRFRRINPVYSSEKWTQDEDEKILNLINIYGFNWSLISKTLKNRASNKIRERYQNILDPKIKRGNFTITEDLKILKLIIKFGNKWSVISKYFDNRSSNIIKSRYYSSIKNKKDLLLLLDSLGKCEFEQDLNGESKNSTTDSNKLPDCCLNFKSEIMNEEELKIF